MSLVVEKFADVCKSNKEGFNASAKPAIQFQEPVAAPLKELGDIATLVKSYSTKIGIACKPPPSVEAIERCFQDCQKIIPLFAVLHSTMAEERDGPLMIAEVKISSCRLLDSLILLANECLLCISESVSSTAKSATNDSAAEARLVSIGKVWESCDYLVNLMTLSSGVLLARKLDNYISYLEDATNDLEEFQKSPHGSFDLDDFDDDVDGEDGGGEEQLSQNLANLNVGESTSDVVEFSKNTLDKLKKISFLLVAIKKRRTQSLTVQTATDIYNACESLSSVMDDLVAGYLMGEDLDELKELDALVNQKLRLLLSLVKPGDDKFTKWVELFESKIFD